MVAMMENRAPRKVGTSVLVGIIILAVILGGLFLRKYAGREPLPKHPPPQSAPEQGVKAVTLFFAAPEGGGLLRESRVIEPCSGVEECSEDILGELINGPIGDLSPTLPETSMFHGVSFSGDTLTIDFSRELQDGLVAGSEAEMSAVYSVVNSMTFNLSQVKKVRFLVDGKPLETLKGHLDLREPLEPDYTYEKKVDYPAVTPTPQRRQP
jgi:hypothetical protein